MQHPLGWITLLFGVAFATGLLLAVTAAAWHYLPADQLTIAFFGFGVPMVLARSATRMLWKGSGLLKVHGWISALFGVLFALALLFYVFNAVISAQADKTFFGFFFGFAVPMLLLGGEGIAILTKKV